VIEDGADLNSRQLVTRIARAHVMHNKRNIGYCAA
jgi:hypothetical protein